MGAAARAGHARLLVLAADAAGNTLRRCSHFAQAGQAPLLQCPFTKAELGLATGRGSCAMLAFTDAGLAAAFASKLAARDDAYGETGRLVGFRAQRAGGGQKEQPRHEKKLQRAKAHPWAPPRTQAAPSKGRSKPGAKGRTPSGPSRDKRANHRPETGTKRGGGRQVT